MDSDRRLDCALLRIKEKLNQNKIKLWLTPYYSDNEGINDNEMKNLAHTWSCELSMSFEVCLESLYKLQKRALDNIREQNNYRNTGVAALKVKISNEHGVGRIITINLQLSKTGLELKELISKDISVYVERLKLVFHGKILKDEETLESQGVKHGTHIMAISLENGTNNVRNHESHMKLLDSMKEDIKLLTEDKVNKDYLQIADQSGKLLQLPENEKTALILAMTLHEKGRAAIKREDYTLALILLLEAEKEFSYCDSNLLKNVDNYGLLNLDIVWCYLNLQSISQLPDAEQRLHQCESCFKQSYGPNLERLIALKGSAGNENALFMRLHLLQAIVLFHQNKVNQSRKLFEKVEQELKQLDVDDSQLSHMVELGYGVVDAWLALRQANGDLNIAVNIIENKLQERKKNEEAEKKDKELKRERKKLGKCTNGDWVEPQFHQALMSMGYSYEVAKWALVQCCNSICNSINLIQEHPEFTMGGSDKITDDSIAKVSSLGFESEAAELALKKHKGDICKAIESLTGGEMNSASLTDISSSSDDSSPSTSEEKHDEAYSRISKGISNCVEDHLNINLTAEKGFLKQYKELLSKW